MVPPSHHGRWCLQDSREGADGPGFVLLGPIGSMVRDVGISMKPT